MSARSVSVIACSSLSPAFHPGVAAMITGVHTMFYTSQAEQLRAFLRDTLGFPYTDVHDGWLIFDMPEAEMGVHPADESHPHSRAGTHDISFYCDDVHKTV